MYDPGDDRSRPPTHAHIDRLSYSLRNGNKEFRALAVQHIAGLENKNHPQFAALRANFDEFKPQIVLYEGPVSNPQSISEEDAYMHGEQAFVLKLVLDHNSNLKAGERPIVKDSWDPQDKDYPEEYRQKGYSNEEIASNEIFKWLHGEANLIRNSPGLSDEQRLQRLIDLQAKYDANPIARIQPDFFSLIPRADGQQWTPELAKAEFQKVTGHSIDVNLTPADAPRLQQMFDDARQFRDEYAIRKKAEALKKYDRVMVVEGSGHAIRDKAALEEFTNAKTEPVQQPSREPDKSIAERTNKAQAEGTVPAISTWVPEQFADLWKSRVEGRAINVQKGVLGEEKINGEKPNGDKGASPSDDIPHVGGTRSS